MLQTPPPDPSRADPSRADPSRVRAGLALGGAAATLGAAAVLLFQNTLVPLLALVAVGAVLVLGLVGLEAWLRGRFSGAPS